MSVDIERTVIFDERVPAIEPALMGASRTIITAGDDGFLSIEQSEGPVYTDEGVKPSTHDRIGLTPPMVKAIIEWAAVSKHPRFS